MRTVTINKRGYLLCDGVDLDCPVRSTETDVQCHIQCAWFAIGPHGTYTLCHDKIIGELATESDGRT